jgi:hypothetical protein
VPDQAPVFLPVDLKHLRYYSHTLHIPVADLLREINKPH